MKKIEKMTFLVVVALLLSCAPEDDLTNEVSEKESLLKNFSTLVIDKNTFAGEWMNDTQINLTFENSYTVGHKNLKSLTAVLNDELNNVESDELRSESELLGLHIVVSAFETKFIPITKDTKEGSFKDLLSRAKGCPEGFESIDVCYSPTCVIKSIANYIKGSADALESGQVISIVLVNHWGGKRVCGKVAELQDQ